MTFEQLTQRETEILALIADGQTNRQIADRLALAKSTVRWYARQIYAKLGVEGRQEAVARALELELLPGTASPPLPPGNIPASATSFVGRQQSLARLDDLLGEPTSRVVTIVGPGGIGKTRLALAAAERQLRPWPDADGTLAYRFPDGVWFIPLAAVSNTGHLVPAIAGALGLPLEGDSGREPETQLLGYLRRKKALLVLDNFEQLVERASFLAEIVATAADIKLLVTSHERLQLHGEQIFTIEGLAVPEITAGGLSTLAGYDSIQLFLNTARRVQPEIELAEADGPYLSRICRAVAGSPLGIELAASWVSVLPLAEIADAIEDSLDLLQTEMRDRPQRHRSIQAALDVSWQRLPPEQQEAVLRLSVFRSGFTRQMAHRVAGAALPLLVQLVYKSWLVYDQKADRYRIHELLRQYGLQQLAADADLQAETREAFTACFFTFLAEKGAMYHGPHQKQAVQAIQVEASNIWQAWEWAVAQQDATRIGQGLDSWCRFLYWVGRIADGETVCRAAAEQLATLDGNSKEASQITVLRAQVLTWQSRFTATVEETAQLLDESARLLERATAVGADTRVQQAFLELGLAEKAETSDIRAVLKHYEHALALFRSLHDRHGIAHALLGLSNVMFRRNKLDQAESYARDSLSILEALGDRLATALAQDTLALLYKHQQQPEKAEKLQRESLRLYQSLHHPRLEMVTAGNLANTLWWLGRFEEMHDVAENAHAIQEDLGLEQNLFVPATVARALLHLGRYREARPVSEEALAVAQASGSSYTGFILMNLGQVATVEGASDKAITYFQEAAATMTTLWPNSMAESLACLAYVWWTESDLSEAGDSLDRALRWSTRIRAYSSCQYCIAMAARLLAARDPERAVELHALSQSYGHIAGSRWFADITGQKLAETAAGLPDGVAASARDRGRHLDVWTTANELLADLKAGILDDPD